MRNDMKTTDFYRYKFSLYDFECGYPTIFLHPLKYRREEFEQICTDCIKLVVVQNMYTMQIPAVSEDRDIVSVIKYDYQENIVVWSNDDHTNFDTLFPMFVNEMVKLGFEVERKNVEASFGVNQYTYIDEYLKDDVNRILDTRIQSESIPTITDDIYDDMAAYVEKNATDVEHAVKLIREYTLKRN